MFFVEKVNPSLKPTWNWPLNFRIHLIYFLSIEFWYLQSYFLKCKLIYQSWGTVPYQPLHMTTSLTYSHMDVSSPRLRQGLCEALTAERAGLPLMHFHYSGFHTPSNGATCPRPVKDWQYVGDWLASWLSEQWALLPDRPLYHWNYGSIWTAWSGPFY